METYKCIKKCQWQARLWKVGDTVSTEQTPPEHFQKLGTSAQVKVIDKPEEKPVQVIDKPEAKNDSEGFNLMAFKAKLRKLGIEVTNKDSKETVLKKYEEYKQMVAEAEKAGIEVPDGATKDEVLALIGG